MDRSTFEVVNFTSWTAVLTQAHTVSLGGEVAFALQMLGKESEYRRDSVPAPWL